MNTQYITTTELREHSSKVVASLLRGEDITLVHRSKIIGSIIPKRETTKELTKEDIKNIRRLAKKMSLPKLSYKERDSLYRKHMTEKYGKNISG